MIYCPIGQKAVLLFHSVFSLVKILLPEMTLLAIQPERNVYEY